MKRNVYSGFTLLRLLQNHETHSHLTGNCVSNRPLMAGVAAFSSLSPQQEPPGGAFDSQKQLQLCSILESPARVHKRIASESDPLLANKIFDMASCQPGFRHLYSTYQILIVKLGRSGHFSLMECLLARLKSDSSYSVEPSLFSRIIRIYRDANVPNKALRTFYTILEFNLTPTTSHLNRILSILVAHPSFHQRALDLFRSAHKYGVSNDTKSYNIIMRAFCYNNVLSVAYSLFNQMLKRDIVPDVESYRILIQALCRKSQVNRAVDLLEDMLNKGFVPDALSFTSLLNSLCRKKQLKEAYKLLCRMKLKGCNPDIIHYNTVILGFCREGRAFDSCKVLEDMRSNGCFPNQVSYRTLVAGLCDQVMYNGANKYMEEMLSDGFSPHFSVVHALIKGFFNVGKVEEACGVLVGMLKHKAVPHTQTWLEIVSRICDTWDIVQMEDVFKETLKEEIKPKTRLVDAGAGLEEYMFRKIRARSSKT